MKDVTNPDHYNQGDIECIDALWAAGFQYAYCVGNAFKYIWRAKYKNATEKDLRKAIFYLQYVLFRLYGEEDPRDYRKPSS